MQLTWAVPNQIVERSGPTGKGLTDFGRALVDELNRLKITVDLAHVNRPGGEPG